MTISTNQVAKIIIVTIIIVFSILAIINGINTNNAFLLKA